MQQFEKLKINLAIADEAHYLKNIDAKRTISISPFLKKLKHILILTGTPAFARPKELFSLLSIIRPDLFKYFREFGLRYCDPKPSHWIPNGINYDGCSNSHELY